MNDRIALLLEAERRGILPPEKQELLNEARARGLIDASEAKIGPLEGAPEWQPKRRTLADIKAESKAPTAAQDSTLAQQIAAGGGKAIRDAALGLGQAVSQGGLSGMAAAKLAELVGLNAPANPVADYLRDRIGANQAADQDLLKTGGGLAGYVLGNVGMAAAPGGAAVAAGSRARSGGAMVQLGKQLLAPRTYSGAAALGATQGFVQPVGEGDSRAGNTAVGAVAGPAGLAVARGIGGTVRGLASLLPAVRASRQERQAAEVILDMAHNPQAVRAALQQSGEIIPGSRPTLAELTRDPGLAGMQRSLANVSEFANELAARNLQRNAARIDFVRQNFGGASEDAAQQIMAARDMAAAPLRKQAERAGGVATQKVLDFASKLSGKKAGMPTVQGAIEDAKALLVNPETGEPFTDVRALYGARKEIGFMLDGLTDKPSAKAARNELMLIRNMLDREIRKAAPEFGQYMRGYRAASRQADQVKVGAELLDRSNASLDRLGNPTLSAAKVARAASDPDALVRQATGFRKASAGRTLTDEQSGALAALRNDLDRQAMTAVEGKAIGSNTVQNAVGMGRLQAGLSPVGQEALRMAPVVGNAVNVLGAIRSQYGERTMQIAQAAMLDPDRAAQILANLPPGQREAVRRSVAPLLSSSMAASLAAAFGANQSPGSLDQP